MSVGDYYTTIFFEWNMYSLGKIKIQKIMEKFGFEWDEKKLHENIPYHEVISIYRLFKTDNRIVGDEKLKDRNGASGIWKNSSGSLKMIVFDSVESDYQKTPVLMVYRGHESDYSEFSKELVVVCLRMGCEVGKFSEGSNGELIEVFKSQLTVEEVEKIKCVEILKKNFDIRIQMFSKENSFGLEFVNEWRGLIDEYGYYSFRSLKKEILSSGVYKNGKENN